MAFPNPVQQNLSSIKLELDIQYHFQTPSKQHTNGEIGDLPKEVAITFCKAWLVLHQEFRWASKQNTSIG